MVLVGVGVGPVEVESVGARVGVGSVGSVGVEPVDMHTNDTIGYS